MISPGYDTLRGVVDGVMLPRLALADRSSTPRHYRYALDKFALFLQREPRLNDLQDELVWGCLQMLLSMDYAPRNVANVRAHLLAAWRFCNRKGLVSVGPDVPQISIPEKIPQAFTLRELRRLFDSAAKQPRTIAGIPCGLWFPGLLHSIFDTGERIGCTLSWQWDWLDTESGDLSCPASARKGRRKPKVYRLRSKALDAVLKIRTDNPLIFPRHCGMPAIYSRLTQILRRAGLPTGREWKFHALRKSHASYVKLNGGDPSESLGHASRRTTEAYLAPRILRNGRHSDFLPEV